MPMGNPRARGTPGFQFIGYKEAIYGVPTILQGDSFAYLPDETGELGPVALITWNEILLSVAA